MRHHAYLSLLVASVALAAPLRPEEIPEPLRPWTRWVLRGQEWARCPFLGGLSNVDRCSWPTRLELRVDDRAGEVTQQWRTYDEDWVPLPGEADRWPQEVTVDGRPAPVVAREEAPGVILTPGDHTIRARFLWDALPESLRVSAESGLVRLVVRGEPVPFPLREADRVWIQRARPPEAEDRLEVLAHRRVVDDVPLQVITRIELRVAGKDREVLLGRALLPGSVPMALSGLPARLEADGRLRVQVSAGQHVIELTARHEGPVASLARADPDGPWAAQEVWSFEARNNLRVVTVEGVTVDPQQTTLPAEWHGLPAYLVNVGDGMRLVEKRRGDADPPPDRLTLSRTLWLDHDGKGLTARDEIGGTLRQSFRLEMGSGTELGRATIDGRDQLITRLRPGGPAGIEVRQGQANVESVARIAGHASLPAVSWNHDFHEVNAVLRIPPGWRLLGAWGADEVPETWLRRWSLLDLFIVLVIAFAVARLWGTRWGVLAFATLGLTATEADAPRWIWVAALCGEALVRVLPPGRIARLARGYRVGAWVVLVLIAVPFVVQHLRLALYPAVSPDPPAAFEESALLDSNAKMVALPASPAPAAAEAPRRRGIQIKETDDALEGLSAPEDKAGVGPAQALMESEVPQKAEPYAADIDPTAQVQTGPGLPRWSWEAATLRFSGPVQRAQRVRLLLAPPWLNLLLAALRVALIALMIGRLLGRLLPPRRGAAALAVLLCLAPGAARADFPPSDVLEELRKRLVERPDCAPHCTSAPRMSLYATPSTLRLRLEVHAAADTAVPLPGSDEWPPERVLLDGAPARALFRYEGSLWIAVAPGRHQVLLEGALPPRAGVQIQLPLRPRRVEVSASGWTVSGVHEDGVADATLLLSRVGQAALEGGLEPTALPPFVSVERTLHLGLTWQVDTTVRRLTPAGAAVVLEVPLLDGESVTTPDVRVENRRVLLNLPAQETERSWQSTVPVRATLALAAPKTAWSEVWRLDTSAVWHVTPRGIPPVQPLDESGRRVPEWRPWPGETLALDVARPAGLAGPTLTIERATLALRPGERATDATLDLEIRSSRGGEHAITLPDGAQLETVAVDGSVQPIRAQKRRVTLPIVPGERRFALSWREPRGIGAAFSGSDVDLGAPAANVDLRVEMPAGRWTLLVGGPRQGPAVLFWSLLCGLLLVAWGLSRSPLVPLRFHQWMLLAIGLSQMPIWAAAIVAGWLLALGARRRWPGDGALWFDLRQVLLLGWTAAALVVLFGAIHQGLLGHPDMQISGNGSHAGDLRWFADRTGAALPRPWAVSVPLIVYRLAMLGWALWIAAALLRWLRWAWTCFSDGAPWRPRPRAAPQPPPSTAAG